MRRSVDDANSTQSVRSHHHEPALLARARVHQGGAREPPARNRRTPSREFSRVESPGAVLARTSVRCVRAPKTPKLRSVLVVQGEAFQKDGSGIEYRASRSLWMVGVVSDGCQTSEDVPGMQQSQSHEMHERRDRIRVVSLQRLVAQELPRRARALGDLACSVRSRPPGKSFFCASSFAASCGYENGG